MLLGARPSHGCRLLLKRLLVLVLAFARRSVVVSFLPENVVSPVVEELQSRDLALVVLFVRDFNVRNLTYRRCQWA